MGKRIIMTGGSGIAGKWVLRYLVEECGHEVLNVDRVPMANPPGRTRTLITDLTDPGQVFSALSATTTGNIFDEDISPKPVDCVIHFGAVPRGMIIPDCETFRNNMVGCWNVLDTAAKLGIPKIILASSESVYGQCFPDRPVDPVYLPLNEEYPCDPHDTYATAKLMSETLAKSYHTRFGIDMYCLRIGNVTDDNDYKQFPDLLKRPEAKRRICWSYIDVRDLATAVAKCVEIDGLGYTIMNVAADDSSSIVPTMDLIKRFMPNVPLKEEFPGTKSLLSNKKIKETLNWEPKHNWRDYVDRSCWE